MAASEIKIFYSWQSDLPGSQTRNLIQGGIDSAVKALKNTVEIIADRDTKGVLGTPEITETIFNKIADSDIFVADISIINKYSTYDDEGKIEDAVKCSPNPNVLVELGFAAGVLGWDHVICIIDTDYGRIEDLPFDLAHRRPFAYSLSEVDKATVRRDISSAVMTAVADVLENGPRARTGYSNLLLGVYDFEQGDINIYDLPSLSVETLPGYGKAKEILIEKGRALIREILAYPEFSSGESTSTDPPTVDASTEASTQDLIKNISTPKQVVIEKKKRQEAAARIKELFDVEVPESFFNFGDLQRKVTLVPQNTEYIGSNDEIDKYDKYEELEFIMTKISLLEIFIGTFEDMRILPLCVMNNSSLSDEEITVTVQIGKGLPVQPSRTLFNSEYSSSEEYTGLEGFVYEEGMIKDVFFLPEDHVQYDTDISYDIQDSLRESQRNVQKYFSGRTPSATVEDYEYEIKKFIAKLQERSAEALYAFEISKLRPQEKKWLGPLIIVRPEEDGQVSLTYTIKSTHSSGIVEGSLSSK